MTRGLARPRAGLAAGLGLMAGVLGLAPPTAAQDIPPRLAFDLGSSLAYDGNPEFSASGSPGGLRFDTSLGLTLNSVTRDQQFSLGLSSLARLLPQDEAGFADPVLTLVYGQQGANSSLSLQANLQTTEVDLFEPLIGADGTVSTTDILATTGTITSRAATLSLATGRQGPLGFDLATSLNDRIYSDTSDPSVFNSTSQSLQAGVQLRLPDGGREISLNTSLGISEFDNAAQTHRESRSLGFGLSQELRPDMTVQANLGQTTVTTDQIGVAGVTSSGATGSLGLNLALERGTASVALSSDRDALGSRQSLSLSRALDLPNGSFSGDLGLNTRGGGQGGQLVGNLSYEQQLATGSVALSLSRQVSLDGDDQDVANTVLGLSYQQQINDLSSMGLSVSVLGTGSGGTAGVAEALRQTLSASYSRALTADWQVTTGYQFRSLAPEGADRTEASSIFLTINRTFVLRP
jgi:hypothetical protein